jgi:NADH-quinone oxidoreductase subunit L
MNQAITYQMDSLLQVLDFSAIGFLLPLLFFILFSFVRFSEKIIYRAAIACLLASFGSLFYFLKPLVHSHQYYILDWFTIAQSKFQITLLIDETCFWVLAMIHLVTLMVIIFSGYYMKSELRFEKYFAYILFFFTAMFGLVLSNNLFLTYIFWELVGFASYALIGFWRSKESAILANKKAFIINRIGDLGFLAAIYILFNQFHTLNLNSIEVMLQTAPKDLPALYFASFAILIAVIAKSAQFPLHVWLPDAMEGPTPVSALIHAATMVIAGVYLLLRITFFFPPEALLFLKYISIISMVMASLFAIAQQDIKKILAYSTISQIGLMLFVISIGNLQLALFHLLTHAFFKAALFLTAGVFIHEKKSQDIRNLTGVAQQLPMAFIAFSMAAAALIGLPFTAAYLSKEAILFSAIHQQGFDFFNVMLLLSVLLTSLYIARIWFYLMAKSDLSITPQTKSVSMNLPIIVLALASLFIAFSINPFHLQAFWFTMGTETIAPIFSIGIVLLSIAGILAVKFIPSILLMDEKNGMVYFLKNGAFIDRLYEYLFVKPIQQIATLLKWLDKHVVDALVNGIAKLAIVIANCSDWFDRNIIDGLVNLIALIAKRFGDIIRIAQTGRVQTYFLLALMLMAIVAWFIY